MGPMPDQEPSEVLPQKILAGATEEELIAEGWAPSSVKYWMGKHKKGKLLSSQGTGEDKGKSAGNGDGAAPPPGGPEEAKSVAKETPPPPSFFIKLTLRMDGDNLFFFYRAKQGGYPGDMSEFANKLMREALQIRGYRLAAVLDPDMAQKVLQECVAESEEQGG